MGDNNSILEVRKRIESRKASNKNEPKKDLKSNNKAHKNSKQENQTLQDFFDESEKLDFNCKSICRIDDDLHDIFTRLKNRTGIKIGPVISTILKHCVDNHKDEIKQLLKDNKYL